MSSKEYPKTDTKWAKYLTITNYFTMNEIEYRKSLILDSGCDYENILKIISQYRKDNKNILFTFEHKNFYFVETIELQNRVDKIKNFWKTTEYFVKDKFSLELLKETLVYEGYYSSTIEGAHSTIKRAQTLSKGYEIPQNKDDRMVLNNFTALMRIKDEKSFITHDLIKQIHKMATQDTLENEKDIGEYRNEANEIVDSKHKVIYTPPSNIEKMHKMLDELLLFLEPDDFKKPLDNIYKAIVFHFLFAYIHPFIDGNGRTVRILFTYLLKYYGYDMFYFISLSEIIYRKKAKDYYKAFIDVERSDLNDKSNYDMTYFFYYMSEVMIIGLDILKTRINTYMREDIIKYIIEEKNIDLTPRQKNIIKILSNKDKSFMLTTKDLSKEFDISVRNIQKDLKLLMDFELVKRVKAPKKREYYFRLNIKL